MTKLTTPEEAQAASAEFATAVWKALTFPDFLETVGTAHQHEAGEADYSLAVYPPGVWKIVTQGDDSALGTARFESDTPWKPKLVTLRATPIEAEAIPLPDSPEVAATALEFDQLAAWLYVQVAASTEAVALHVTIRGVMLMSYVPDDNPWVHRLKASMQLFFGAQTVRVGL